MKKKLIPIRKGNSNLIDVSPNCTKTIYCKIIHHLIKLFSLNRKYMQNILLIK